MNYNTGYPYSLNLLSRNEGKIKSYESCRDLRAWSHVTERRDHYLREWIKCDLPISVIPSSALIYIFRKMTCCSKSLVIPRCHLNCKSKALLESICNSCHAMKDCFRKDQTFDKYFEDEEFETCHWPCERCLDALKSIKMFWKVIVEKVLNIKIPKSIQLDHSNSFSADKVKSVAKIWQADMERQTTFVKSFKPLPSQNSYPIKAERNIEKNVTAYNVEPNRIDSVDSINRSNKSRTSRSSRFSKTTDTQDLPNSFVNGEFQTSSPYSQRISRQTSTKLLTVDTACSCSDINDEITTYKVNLNCLREQLYIKSNEIEKLKKENDGLKIKLQSLCKNLWCGSSFYTPDVIDPSDKEATDKLPKPYEACDLEENMFVNRAKPIDSEMIITMKNCKNESYRHISLLQVLHKTNALDSDLSLKETCCHKENPIALLQKVQNKFGAIVSRELSRASGRSCCDNNIDIDASYHKANGCKLEPSCSTITSSSCNSYCLAHSVTPNSLYEESRPQVVGIRAGIVRGYLPLQGSSLLLGSEIDQLYHAGQTRWCFMFSLPEILQAIRETVRR